MMHKYWFSSNCYVELTLSTTHKQTDTDTALNKIKRLTSFSISVSNSISDDKFNKSFALSYIFSGYMKSEYYNTQ